MTWATAIYYECRGVSGKTFSGVLLKKGILSDDPETLLVQVENEIRKQVPVGFEPIDEFLELVTTTREI